MNERQEERLSPLPKIGEGFGEWSEAFLARKVGWSVKKSAGQSPALGPFARVGASPMEVSLDDETSIGLEGKLGKPFLP